MEFASTICCAVGLWDVGEGGVEEAAVAMRDIEELLLSARAAMSFLLESFKLVLSWMLLNDDAAAWEQFEVLNNSTSAVINSDDDGNGDV